MRRDPPLVASHLGDLERMGIAHSCLQSEQANTTFLMHVLSQSCRVGLYRAEKEGPEGMTEMDDGKRTRAGTSPHTRMKWSLSTVLTPGNCFLLTMPGSTQKALALVGSRVQPKGKRVDLQDGTMAPFNLSSIWRRSGNQLS